MFSYSHTRISQVSFKLNLFINNNASYITKRNPNKERYQNENHTIKMIMCAISIVPNLMIQTP